MAAVNRIADVLAARGDAAPVGARRARAIGILARPDRALQLLSEHRLDAPPADLPAEPGDDDFARGDDHRSVPVDGPAGPAPAATPSVVLHLHLTDHALQTGQGLVRPEHGSALTLGQLHELLRDTGCNVTVRPVVDPATTAPVDAYEIPARLRTAVRLRHVAEVFPYGTCTSAHLDLDHTRPYVRGGPPGQTGLHNLGPLSRTHHRAVTFGRWGRRQPRPGTYVFRSPTGYVFLVTNQGTLGLGHDSFAEVVWRAAATRAEHLSAA